MEHQKKKRGENWSCEEKEILRQLIAQSANIIEDKSTKTSVNILKAKEWKNIKNKFNERTGKSRSNVEIKLAWKRMKITAKTNLSAHGKAQLKTGGSENPSPSLKDLAIMVIAPHDYVIKINECDSNAMIQTSATAQDPIADPSSDIGDSVIVDNEENPEYNLKVEQETENTETSESVISQIETIDKSDPIIKRKKSAQNRRKEERNLIIESNIEFKKRQLEMMVVEHRHNIKISELKIRKLELEITLLESKNNSGEK